MNYKADSFLNLQNLMSYTFGDEDGLLGPIFEDEDDHDQYFERFKGYDYWLVENQLKDTLDSRAYYLHFIISLIKEKNSPEYFGYHLKLNDFETLEKVVAYYIKEVENPQIDPDNEFNDFMISAQAEAYEDLEDLRVYCDEKILEKYFNNRWDLFDFFISGLYSMLDYLYYPAPEM